MKKQKGFTFIELLVSVTIMAVLMAAAIVSYSNTNLRSRDAKRKADLEVIRSALEICRSNYSEYPSSIASNITCTQSGVPTSMKTLESTPVDPKDDTPYVYTPGATVTEYTLSANLELPTYPTVYSLKNP